VTQLLINKRMLTNNAFGSWLQQRRRTAGWTQRELAERLGYSLSLVRKLEHGERRPPPDLLDRLRDLFAVDSAEYAAIVGQFAAHSTPPLRPPGAVPAPPNPLIGRTADLRAVQRSLSRRDARLLTIIGPPGVGKTRLAQHVAANLEPLYAGRVHYISLAPLSAPEQLLPALAQVLELSEQAQRPLLTQISDMLYGTPRLLVFDNFEHMLAAAAALAELLMACPQLQILATSRAPLRLRAEQLYPLAPLSLPSEQHPDHIAQSAAVQLFVDRARALVPTFALQPVATTVAAICTRLDGLPLAIELAAARSDRFTPEALLNRLTPLLPHLNDGPRDLPERQRTLQNAIAWSYALLTPAAQAVFRRLGIFVGGCDLLAAQALCTTPTLEVQLQHLGEQQLIQIRNGRYLLLETLRAFALEQLEAAGELAEAQADHAAYFVELAVTAEHALEGTEQQYWLSRIDAERANFRAARTWSLAHDGGLSGLRISTALYPFWWIRGLYGEGRRWIEPLLTDVAAADSRLLGRAYYAASYLASQQSDLQCYDLLDTALAHFRTINDERGIARCLNLWGIFRRVPGRLPESVALYEESLALLRNYNEPMLLSTVLNNLGMTLAALGDYGNAIARFREAIACARDYGNHVRATGILPNLADALRMYGERDQAYACFHEALELGKAFGMEEIIAEAYDGLGMIALADGDPETADRLLNQSLTMYTEMGLLFAIVRVNRNLGYLALQRNHPDAARRAFHGALHPQSLPGLADIAAHALAGLALIAARTGIPAEAARLQGIVDALHSRYPLRPEPLDTEVQHETRTLAAEHPVWAAAYAAGCATPESAILASLSTD
jgi:predicted ATPase